MMEKLDKMMATDIPRLMNLIPHEDRELKEDGRTQVTHIVVELLQNKILCFLIR